MNIGLVLGSASQIVGIDIDGDDAMKELHSWANGALPETWAFTTPSGGMRMLYRAPKDQVLKKYVKKLPGEHCELALLGDGQQTIMPPSTVNGKAYQWLTGRSPDKQQLADAPQWLLDRMSGKATTSATNGTTSKPNKLHEAVFTRLANQCSLFKLHLQEQKDTGLSEDEWHNWTRLLTNANSPEVATSFSLLSKSMMRGVSNDYKSLLRKSLLPWLVVQHSAVALNKLKNVMASLTRMTKVKSPTHQVHLFNQMAESLACLSILFTCLTLMHSKMFLTTH